MVFKINPQAKIDIQEQIHYYNKKQTGLGKRFHEEVKRTFKTLRNSPNFQVRYKNVHCVTLKKFPAMVHYTFENNIIVIRAVFHTSLNPKKWGERE